MTFWVLKVHGASEVGRNGMVLDRVAPTDLEAELPSAMILHVGCRVGSLGVAGFRGLGLFSKALFQSLRSRQYRIVISPKYISCGALRVYCLGFRVQNSYPTSCGLGFRFRL